jgi:hypothetical protein
MYCASHQEIRELAVRGIDGPGMHILDVSPESYPPESRAAAAARGAMVAFMLSHPPRLFKSRITKEQAAAEEAEWEARRIQRHSGKPIAYASEPTTEGVGEGEAAGTTTPTAAAEGHKRTSSMTSTESGMMGAAMGWPCPPGLRAAMRAPEMQEMHGRTSESARGELEMAPRSRSEEFVRMVGANDGDGNSDDEVSPRAWSVAY